MLIRKSPYFVLLIFCLAFSGLVNAAEQPLRLGLGLKYRSPVFSNADGILSVIPVARYESNRISLRGTTLDWKLVSKAGWSSGLGLNFDSTYQDRNESKDFESWSEIALRINVHVFASAYLGTDMLGRIAYSHDVSGETKADTATLEIRKEVRLPIGAMLVPTVGIKWLDKQTFEYLFTNDADVEGESAVNPFISLDFIAPLTERLALMSNLTWRFLDKEIKRLEIIDSDSRYSAQVSVLYKID